MALLDDPEEKTERYVRVRVDKNDNNSGYEFTHLSCSNYFQDMVLLYYRRYKV